AFSPSCRNTSKPSPIFSLMLMDVSSIIARDGPVMRRHAVRQIEHHFVDIAPSPAFRRVITFYDGMLAAMEMLGGVLVLGRIAATDMAASPAQAQMQPHITALQAFLAAQRAGRDVADRVQMRAAVGRHSAALAAARSCARKPCSAATTCAPSPTAAAT